MFSMSVFYPDLDILSPGCVQFINSLTRLVILLYLLYKCVDNYITNTQNC